MNLLTKAIVFATEKYEGYKKETNMPYIIHPAEALSIAATLTNDENVLAATVLHDVVEDCGVSLSEIKFTFGQETAKLIGDDTEDKREKQSAESTWKNRKQKTLEQIEKMDKKSKIIVLCDKLSNMRAIYRDYDEIGDSLWQKLSSKSKDEQCWYYESILRLLENDFKNTSAWLEYKTLINKVFHSKKWYEILIRKDFVDYFSDESNTFYKEVDGEKVLEPLFEKFKDIVIGLTYAGSLGEIRFSSYEDMIENEPNIYLGYIYMAHYKKLKESYLTRVWQTIDNGKNGGHYEIEPELLTAEQIAMLIMYPFCSRMGGSFEITFLEDGRLKKYLLALKKKHLEEIKLNSDNNA